MKFSDIRLKLKTWAKQLKIEIEALSLASCDRRVPWYAKLWLILVLGYALSPIDLIPDFIPVLGYLDDLLLLPIGLAIAIHLVPPEVMADCRQQATTQSLTKKPKNWVAGGIIITVWIALGLAIALALGLSNKDVTDHNYDIREQIWRIGDSNP